jgi:hypothetical protein
MLPGRSVRLLLSIAFASQPWWVGGVGAQPVPTGKIKVVRLIVVRPGQPIPTPKGVADVLIMKTEGTDGLKWRPMSFVNGKPMDHGAATEKEAKTVVRLTVPNGDQIEWQSDVPFSIAAVTSHKHNLKAFPTKGTPPPERPSGPFEPDLLTREGQMGKPIRSGPPTRNNEVTYYQLYKVSFKMLIDKESVDIDPDVYCEWQTGGGG